MITNGVRPSTSRSPDRVTDREECHDQHTGSPISRFT
ncbi:hypothetical protein Ae505Ps2_0523 [Pseudonocardia sp. Ae505_Ps2]|nr:hypothetical protein Ae505Ps2_0523 [Pseudonocardia sp. Ae505_Ps2]